MAGIVISQFQRLRQWRRREQAQLGEKGADIFHALRKLDRGTFVHLVEDKAGLQVRNVEEELAAVLEAKRRG